MVALQSFPSSRELCRWLIQFPQNRTNLQHLMPAFQGKMTVQIKYDLSNRLYCTAEIMSTTILSALSRGRQQSMYWTKPSFDPSCFSRTHLWNLTNNFAPKPCCPLQIHPISDKTTPHTPAWLKIRSSRTPSLPFVTIIFSFWWYNAALHRL